jgi:hypothetical protein
MTTEPTTIEKAAQIICQTDDPCCKGEGCDHGKELYADSIRAILTAWEAEPPKPTIGAIVSHLWSRGYTQVTTADIKTAWKKGMAAVLEEKQANNREEDDER